MMGRRRISVSRVGAIPALALWAFAAVPMPDAVSRVYDPHQNPPPQPRNLQDWITPKTKKELREFPEDGSVPLENPPAFGWRSDRYVYSFQLSIERNGQPFRDYLVTNNIFRPAEIFPPGDYTWRVRQLDQGGRPRASGAPAARRDRNNRRRNSGGGGNLSAETRARLGGGRFGGGTRMGRAPDAGWSSRRAFTIHDSGLDFFAADIWTAFGDVEARKRPRGLPDAFGPRGKGIDLNQPEVKQVVRVILKRFERDVQAEQKEAKQKKPKGRKSFAGADRGILKSRQIRSELRQLTRKLNDALVIATLYRGKPKGKNAVRFAKTYVDRLISFDAFGRTSHAGDDLLNIRLARNIARAFDILYRDLSKDKKVLIRRHIEFRTQAAFDFFLLNDRGNLGQFAMSSHGFQIATHILAIAVLMIGDSDRAVLWFRETYPLISTVVTPWGGDDGGYSNGINYGVWEFVNHIESWDIIYNASGFSYFDTAWVQNFIEYLAYVVPPGVAHAGPGDGGELLRPALWTDIAAIYQQRGSGAFARQMANGWKQQNKGKQVRKKGNVFTNALLWTRLFSTRQIAERNQHQGMKPGKLPNTAIFPNIGWGVVHTSLKDPMRYSLIFKSSQFGSFNHSHADQNSFMIQGHGKPLLIDSGFYDGYRSPHHNKWTRQTRAHNAITFDGGKGQPIDDPGASGRLVQYWRCRGAVAFAGEATKAYGGDITDAYRSLIFLPDNNILVYDQMTSRKPKRWEWNLHAAVPMKQGKDGSVTVKNGKAVARVIRLASPAATFKTTNKFTAPPNKRLFRDGQSGDQFHGTFVSNKPARTLTMLTLIRLDDAAKQGAPKKGAFQRVGPDSFRFKLGKFSGEIGRHVTQLTAGVNLQNCEVPPRQKTRTASGPGRLRMRTN